MKDEPHNGTQTISQMNKRKSLKSMNESPHCQV